LIKEEKLEIRARKGGEEVGKSLQLGNGSCLKRSVG